jgi:serine protease Do
MVGFYQNNQGMIMFFYFIFLIFVSKEIQASGIGSLYNKLVNKVVEGLKEKKKPNQQPTAPQARPEIQAVQQKTQVISTNSVNKIGTTIGVTSELSVASVVEKSSPAVVDLFAWEGQTQLIEPSFDSFFRDYPGNAKTDSDANVTSSQQSSGSGVIIDPSGIIVTCAHIIKGANFVTVRLNNGRILEAKIIDIDIDDDIAFLKIQIANSQKLPQGIQGNQTFPYLKIGNSDIIRDGDKVLTVGNFFGIGQSVFSGIISAAHRDFNNSIVIQIDSIVTPGNSGGALINMNGELIGIPNALLSKKGYNIGFAIPSNFISVKRDELMANKAPVWFGVFVSDHQEKRQENIYLNPFFKVYVTHVDPRSPLYNKLKVSDTILSINGKNIKTSNEFHFQERVSYLNSHISLQVYRNGKIVDLAFLPIPAPEIQLTLLRGNHFLNMYQVAKVSADLAHQVSLPPATLGVMILGLPTLASNAFINTSSAFKVGDIIQTINNRPIKEIRDLNIALNQKQAGVGFSIDFLRHGQPRHLNIS